MVHQPTRGAGPARFGPDVPMVPDVGPGIVAADVYTNESRVACAIADTESRVAAFRAR